MSHAILATIHGQRRCLTNYPDVDTNCTACTAQRYLVPYFVAFWLALALHLVITVLVQFRFGGIGGYVHGWSGLKELQPSVPLLTTV